ncbi:phosphatase PAP2 family protein [Nitrogeniibacter mangrovi]|uniref:Phosphatase PAP2 family protein n=1 Tax=Nitrogeniibacter mangrovi TaxID=2016596 RepID=A0A6C1B4D3_9RHOO|nr:phosphatase PAP2 family protein [Nitrogeniibacter mangrovi]QID17869.1 phosphatase PAP2 family protein [Nitrogeniibacter mangrovi]
MLPPLVCALGAVLVHTFGANTEVFLALQHATGHFPDTLWAFLTDQASVASVAAWMALALLVKPVFAAAVLLSWPAGIVLVRGLKYLVDAPRPEVLLPPDAIHVIGVRLDTLSFPSGHTATAFAVASALLFSLSPGARALWLLPALSLATAIGLSRIAVGAHWPVDVLAGAAIGWLCGVSGALWAQRWRFWTRRAGMLVLAGLGLVSGMARLVLDSGYPSVAPFAGLLGVAALSISVWTASRQWGAR